MADSELNRNGIQKKWLLLEINTITKLILFRMTGAVYLNIDTYNYFIITMRKRNYSFIY